MNNEWLSSTKLCKDYASHLRKLRNIVKVMDNTMWSIQTSCHKLYIQLIIFTFAFQNLFLYTLNHFSSYKQGRCFLDYKHRLCRNLEVDKWTGSDPVKVQSGKAFLSFISPLSDCFRMLVNITKLFLPYSVYCISNTHAYLLFVCLWVLLRMLLAYLLLHA